MQKKQVGTPNFTVKENDSLSSPSGLCVCVNVVLRKIYIHGIIRNESHGYMENC